jgi:predicted secreted hydrolase
MNMEGGTVTVRARVRPAGIFTCLWILPVILLLATPAAAQPLVGDAPEGFAIAQPGWVHRFPRDHGAHEEFRIEWWYFTGHLFAKGGGRYGFEVTFFRVGVTPPAERAEPRPPWRLDDLALAHFAITDVTKGTFHYDEKLNRSSRFTAGARAGSLRVFNEGWSATMEADGSIVLRAQSPEYEIDLRMRSRKPPAIHGERGVSIKGAGEGHASHYYSLTRLEVEGTIRDGKQRMECEGLAWMDHEFGSALLREDQKGWDWFSIQLDDDTELMLYQIRTTAGEPDVTSSGSFITESGDVILLRNQDFSIRPVDRWTSPRSGATYPMGWRIEVPSLGVRLDVRETLRDQELITDRSTGVTYWEGAVDVSGRSGANAVRGRGYVEMTGYADGN